MKAKVMAIGAVCLLFLPAVQTKRARHPLAYKLAVIDKGWVSDNDIIITRFKSLLKQLSNTYVETQQQIADMTVKAQQVLREESGIKESLMNIMEGMNKIFPEKIANQKYAEYVSAYMVLRTKGQSHNEAIEGLQAIVAAITRE